MLLFPHNNGRFFSGWCGNITTAANMNPPGTAVRLTVELQANLHFSRLHNTPIAPPPTAFIDDRRSMAMAHRPLLCLGATHRLQRPL